VRQSGQLEGRKPKVVGMQLVQYRGLQPLYESKAAE